MNINNRLRSVLLAFIVVIWGVNMVVPIFSRTYQPPAELNGVFSIVAGGLVASFAQKRGGGNGGNNSSGNSGGSNGGGGPT